MATGAIYMSMLLTSWADASTAGNTCECSARAILCCAVRWHLWMGTCVGPNCHLVHHPAVRLTVSHAPAAVGEQSMWIRIASQWMTFLLFFWTMCAPLCFPNRDFSDNHNQFGS